MQASITPVAPAGATELAADLLALWRHILSTGHADAYAGFEELDLTLTQVKTLNALASRELTVKDLAERLGLSLRFAGIATFAATLPAAQCKRLSGALKPILDRLPA
jgi:hypothetical protein